MPVSDEVDPGVEMLRPFGLTSRSPEKRSVGLYLTSGNPGLSGAVVVNRRYRSEHSPGASVIVRLLDGVQDTSGHVK